MSTVPARDGVGPVTADSETHARRPARRHRLFWKYVVHFVVLVSSALLASGAVSLYFSYRETRAAVAALQHEKAVGAAVRIQQFLDEIRRQIEWVDQPRMDGYDSIERRHLGFIRLLHQAPAVSDVTWLNANGREQLAVSRSVIDRLHSGIDRSATPAFQATRSARVYFSPVYFRQETEPYLSLALASAHRDGGVITAEVNLKFVWDVMAQVRIGMTGHAYVVDRQGQLISHPDISLVLQRTDVSMLPQVRAAFAPAVRATSAAEPGAARGRNGEAVLVASAPIDPVGWAVLVEQPTSEAYAPLYASLWHMVLLWFLGLALALGASLALARRMVRPIQALQAGAARLGAGRLDERIAVGTRDELAMLADEFNRMGARLRESYADLERKVEERTRELAAANQAKSRFLAAASHDLRQPLHALGLFVAQLRNRAVDPVTRRIAVQTETAVETLQELFDAVLDASRLDAGAITPQLTTFALGGLLERLVASFAPAANHKALNLRRVPTRLAVRADAVLVERILINLLSNAVRYTERGGIVVGCRRRAGRVRIEVWDSGIGIPPAQHDAVFQEFYQIDNPERDRQRGLGLGLAIAARLAHLLESRIELASRPGKGSVFAFELPRAEISANSAADGAVGAVSDHLYGASIWVVDDDPLVRDVMDTLLAQWGCKTTIAACGDDAVAALARDERTPDAILCDYRLPGSETGIETIRRLRRACETQIPAVLITGDTAPDRINEAKQCGLPLLQKPVRPAKLRAMLERLLAQRSGNDTGA